MPSEPVHSPVVSVIVPVYNVAPYLTACLDSLRGQTLADVEILCVDDGSRDGSDALVARAQAQDSRVRLLRQPHQGVSAARNLGLRQARGTYVAFVDADDWVEPDMLERLVDLARSTDCDVAVCGARVHFEGPRRESLQEALTVSPGQWTAEGPQAAWQLLERPGMWPFIWNKLLRTGLLRRYALEFRTQLPLGEDGAFIIALVQYARRVSFLPQALYHYRYQRKSSATDELYQDRRLRLERHVQVARALWGDFSNRGLLEENGPYLLRWTVDFLYADFLRLAPEHRREVSRQLERLPTAAFAPALTGRYRRRLADLLAPRPPAGAVRLWQILRAKLENRLLPER